DRDGDDDHGPAREVLLQRDDDPLEEREPEGDLQPASLEPDGCAASLVLCCRLRHARNLPRWAADPNPAMILGSGSCSLGLRRVVEESVDGGAGTADVGSKRSQRA